MKDLLYILAIVAFATVSTYQLDTIAVTSDTLDDTTEDTIAVTSDILDDTTEDTIVVTSDTLDDTTVDTRVVTSDILDDTTVDNSTFIPNSTTTDNSTFIDNSTAIDNSTSISNSTAVTQTTITTPQRVALFSLIHDFSEAVNIGDVDPEAAEYIFHHFLNDAQRYQLAQYPAVILYYYGKDLCAYVDARVALSGSNVIPDIFSFHCTPTKKVATTSTAAMPVSV